MSLFRPAEVTSAFLKMGLLGFQGSGKTKTATKTAIGLVKHLKALGLPIAHKPVFFLDTETGSDWVIPDFSAAGIPLVTAKTRAFADLVRAVPEAEANGSALLIDSATHFWRELCESYSKRRAEALKRPAYKLQLNDWGYLKGPEGWGKFADLFVNSKLHIILAGRAGYEYDFSEDDDGNKQLEKTGIKMKAESDFGFEPSLLVYMERHMDVATKRVWRTASVLKDRAALIDGKEFENPDFKDFLPHLERINLGGHQLGVDTTRTSEHLFPRDARDHRRTQRKIVLAEIEDLLVTHYPASTGKDKVSKIAALKKHFNASWAEIEEVMSLEDLRAGYDTLHQELEGKPSRYGRLLAIEAKPEIDDAIPEPHPLDIPPYLDRRSRNGAGPDNDPNFMMWGIAAE